MSDTSSPSPISPRRRSDKTSVYAVSALMAAASGCASFSTHLTPRPTPTGRWEVAGHIDVSSYVEDNGSRATGPAPEIQARYGLSPLVDIGAKVHALGGELNSR